MTHPFDFLALDNGARFIFTPCPGTKATSVLDAVTTLQQAGADSIITLMADEELSRNDAQQLPTVCNDLSIDWFQLPIKDDCEPEADFATAFEQYKAELLNQIDTKKTIAIHCRGGSGRTGLMAAILMLESGTSWQQVKASIQAIRPKALSLEPHLNYLKTHYSI